MMKMLVTWVDSRDAMRRVRNLEVVIAALERELAELRRRR